MLIKSENNTKNLGNAWDTHCYDAIYLKKLVEVWAWPNQFAFNSKNWWYIDRGLEDWDLQQKTISKGVGRGWSRWRRLCINILEEYWEAWDSQ